MGFGIWDWDGNGIWDWDGIWDWGGIMTNGMGWDGYGMGFDTNGNWDSPIPISMGGKYRYDYKNNSKPDKYEYPWLILTSQYEFIPVESGVEPVHIIQRFIKND